MSDGDDALAALPVDHDFSLDEVDEAANTENEVDASVLFVLASEEEEEEEAAAAAAAAPPLLVGGIQGCWITDEFDSLEEEVLERRMTDDPLGITATDEWLLSEWWWCCMKPDSDEDEVDGVVVEFVLVALLPVLLLLHRHVENPEKKHTEH